MLFALHQLQGQVADLHMTLDDIRDGRSRRPLTSPARAGKPGPEARARESARSRARAAQDQETQGPSVTAPRQRSGSSRRCSRSPGAAAPSWIGCTKC